MIHKINCHRRERRKKEKEKKKLRKTVIICVKITGPSGGSPNFINVIVMIFFLFVYPSLFYK